MSVFHVKVKPFIRGRRSPEKMAFRRDLRRRMTVPERLLWSMLRGGKMGTRFYRQHPVIGFIADFWCRSGKLVVEVDGEIHLSKSKEDTGRDVAMSKAGFRIIRLPNSWVMSHPLDAVRLIWAASR